LRLDEFLYPDVFFSSVPEGPTLIVLSFFVIDGDFTLWNAGAAFLSFTYGCNARFAIFVVMLAFRFLAM